MFRLRYRGAHLEAIRAPLVTLAKFIDLNWSRVASLDIASMAPYMAAQLPAGVDVAAVVAALVNGADADAAGAGASAGEQQRGAFGGAQQGQGPQGQQGSVEDSMSAFFGTSTDGTGANAVTGAAAAGAAAAAARGDLYSYGAASSNTAYNITQQMQRQQHQNALALLVELCRTQAARELALLVQLRSTLRLAIQALTVTIAFAKVAVGLATANPAFVSAALSRSTRFARAANVSSASLAWDYAFDRLPDRLCKQLTSLRFKDLVTATHGRAALRQLAWRVASMVQVDSVTTGLSLTPFLDAGLASAAGGNINDVEFEDMLARECPAFFPAVDHWMVKAQRLIAIASQPQLPALSLQTAAVASATAALGAAHLPVKHAHRGRLVDAAVALFIKICATEECDIRGIIDILVGGSFYEAAAEVLVARADMLSRLSASPQGMIMREGCCRVPGELTNALATVEAQQQWLQRAQRAVQVAVQGIIEDLLSSSVAPSSAGAVAAFAAAAASATRSGAAPATVDGQLSQEQCQVHYEAAMRVLLRCTIRLIHDAVYSFLLDEASEENNYHQALLVIKHPALAEFLWCQVRLHQITALF